MPESHLLVSVSVITYNHEKFIEKALDSILSQKTSFDFEIVIGDDGSTDKTYQICAEHQKSSEIPIRLFNRDRSNYDKSYIHSARQNFLDTLKSCQGKYIALLDGDDYWTDELKLQKQVDFLESSSSYSACVHRTFVLNSDGTLEPHRTKYKDSYTLNDLMAKYSLFHTSSFFFRKRFLHIPSWMKTISSGDLPLFAIMANQGPIRFLSEVKPSIYRMHSGGITKSSFHNGIQFHLNRINMLDVFESNFYSISHKRLSLVRSRHLVDIMNNKEAYSSPKNPIILKQIGKHLAFLPVFKVMQFILISIKCRLFTVTSKKN
ncbi:MAG: glycosyltransferase [Cyclobacteriaceae bacterium]